LDQKYIGLYFSASWCGPCRKFTPKLVEFRNKFSDEFEVILIGGDGSSKAQANYMKKYSMPWYAMQNQSTEAKFASRFCEVKSIPYLVILDQEGNIITKNGKSDLIKMGDQALEEWKNK
jgi:nucleoredoxin